jgi:hypothetical protein
VGRVKVLPIDIRREYERIRGVLAHREIESARQGNVNRLAAVCTGGFHLRLEVLFPYAPFDEGRRYRVDRSSREGGFTAFETDQVRCLSGSDGKCPEYRPCVIPNQEEEIPLEIPEDLIQFGRLNSELA